MIRRLLAAPSDAHDRRILVAGVGGILLTVQLSLQQAMATRPVIAVALDAAGALIAIGCLRTRWHPRPVIAMLAATVCLVFCAVTAVLGVSQLARSLAGSETSRVCADDVGPATVGGGQLLLAGRNPYTSYDSLATQERLRCPTFHATPVRQGALSGVSAAPGPARVQQLISEARRDPSVPGLERGFDYPVGTAVAGMVGARGVLQLTAAVMVLAGVLVVRSVPRHSRRPLALALGAQTGALVVVGAVRPDGIVVALLMVACSRPSTRTGGLALGLGCAIKQTAWYLAPALVVTAWRRDGPAAAARVIGSAALGFGLVNGSFIVAAPAAWLRGVLAPLTIGLFPLGSGPVNLIILGVLPVAVLPVTSVLMYACVMGGAGTAAALDRRLPGIGIVVGSLGLWAGPRSLNYYLAGLGLLAVIACASAPAPSRIRRLRGGEGPAPRRPECAAAGLAS
jgi:hypothetical protein